LIHSDIEGVRSTQRSQRHFQNFSVFSFGAIVPPANLHFSYEVGADECSIWGIIAAPSHGLRAKTSQRANVYCLTASMFFLECTIGPSWAVPMDIGGEVSGTVSGMMNMAGNFGGALSQLSLASWFSSDRGKRHSLLQRASL
jgi:hypothetical protein